MRFGPLIAAAAAAALMALAERSGIRWTDRRRDNTVIPYFWLDTTNPPPTSPPVPPPSPPPTMPSTFVNRPVVKFPKLLVWRILAEFPAADHPRRFSAGLDERGDYLCRRHSNRDHRRVVCDLPFCSTALPCSDAFTGFTFTFSSGVLSPGLAWTRRAPRIFAGCGPPRRGSNWSRRPTSSSNVTGDLPPKATNSPSTSRPRQQCPPSPEPSTWALTLLGFAGLGVAGYRRMGSAGGAARIG